MVRVLVIGANGYIGNAVARQLRQSGNTVYGLVRNEQQVVELRKQEIIPVVGDITDSKTYLEVVDKVQVVVDTAMVFGADIAKPNRELLHAVIASGKKQGSKKRYIYTSGCLVYGDNPHLVDEDTKELSPLGAWRSTFDREVIGSSDVEGVVLRPAFVYGGNFGHYAGFLFTPNANGDIEIRGKPERQWSWVHVEDLARAYVAAVEAPGALVAGQIFNVGDATRVTYEQAVTTFSRAAGVTGKVVHAPIAADDFFGNYANVTALVDSSKLQRVLGWVPRFQLLDQVEILTAAYLAHHRK